MGLGGRKGKLANLLLCFSPLANVFCYERVQGGSTHDDMSLVISLTKNANNMNPNADNIGNNRIII